MEPPLTIALFIDADNLSNAHIAAVLDELEQYGTVTIRRAYGNWASPCLSAWKTKLHQFAIKPIQQFDLTKGKNATDIALTIDVMDCLHTKAIDIFAIAASDCDYTPLVMRLKEENKTVLGFGEAKSPQTYVDSFSQFVELDRKQNEDILRLEHVQTDTDHDTFSAFLDQLDLPKPDKPKSASRPVETEDKKANKLLNKQLKAAIKQAKDDSGWAHLGPVGKYMSALTGFSLKAHGAKNLSSLLRSLDKFEVAQRQNGLWVKVKAKTS